MDMLGFNEAIDQLAMESSVRCHGYVMWRVLALTLKVKDEKGVGVNGMEEVCGGSMHSLNHFSLRLFQIEVLHVIM